MNSEKYIGLDVHQATISVAVMDSTGKLVMECILETKSGDYSSVLCGTTWNFVGDLRVRGLSSRSVEPVAFPGHKHRATQIEPNRMIAAICCSVLSIWTRGIESPPNRRLPLNLRSAASPAEQAIATTPTSVQI